MGNLTGASAAHAYIHDPNNMQRKGMQHNDYLEAKAGSVNWLEPNTLYTDEHNHTIQTDEKKHIVGSSETTNDGIIDGFVNKIKNINPFTIQIVIHTIIIIVLVFIFIFMTDNSSMIAIVLLIIPLVFSVAGLIHACYWRYQHYKQNKKTI